MAEANAAKKSKDEQAPEAPEGAAQAKDRKSMILMILVTVNSLVFLAVGFGLWSYSNATKAAIKQETEIEEHAAAKADGGHGAAPADAGHAVESKVVALETFFVNLTGSEGYKLMKVTMSFDVDNAEVQEEIVKRQAHVRDVIVILLSSKTYGEVSGENAQQKLKDEIMDTVNSFLTKGKIKKILFTDFLFN